MDSIVERKGRKALNGSNKIRVHPWFFSSVFSLVNPLGLLQLASMLQKTNPNRQRKNFRRGPRNPCLGSHRRP